MHKLIIIGAGGLGREVAWLVERINSNEPTWNLLGFLDDSDDVQEKEINGYSVLGRTDKVSEFSDVYYVCAIGSSEIRKRVVEKIKSVNPEIQFAKLIDPSVECSKHVCIGEGTIVCAHTIITVNADIGRYVIINLDCTIAHDASLDDYCTLHPSVNVSGNVSVGMKTEIGTGAQIIQGISVGRGSVIGAGATVIGDIQDEVTVFGNPAKIIKKHESIVS